MRQIQIKYEGILCRDGGRLYLSLAGNGHLGSKYRVPESVEVDIGKEGYVQVQGRIDKGARTDLTHEVERFVSQYVQSPFIPGIMVAGIFDTPVLHTPKKDFWRRDAGAIQPVRHSGRVVRKARHVM